MTYDLSNLICAAVCESGPMILTLDAENAFDRMHWEYISQTLSKFGLQGFIHSAIMALYTHPTAKVFSSGMLSRNFALTRPDRVALYPH